MEKTLIQPLIAVLISSLIAIRSYRRKSLDLSGALAGFIVMTIHFAVGYRFGAMLLAFFFSSSKLTKVGEERKRQVDADFKEGGQRNWIQVLFNSGIATVFSVIIWDRTGWEDKCLDSKESVLITSLIGGIIGHYSCCNGDTWSSEIGVLSDDQPLLITTFKVDILFPHFINELIVLDGNFSINTTCHHVLFKLSKHFSIYLENESAGPFQINATIHLTFYSLGFIVAVQKTWLMIMMFTTFIVFNLVFKETIRRNLLLLIT